jgi:hypothetical protein
MMDQMKVVCSSDGDDYPVSSDFGEELSDTNNVVLPVTLPFFKVEGQVSNSRIQTISVCGCMLYGSLSLSTLTVPDV